VIRFNDLFGMVTRRLAFYRDRVRLKMSTYLIPRSPVEIRHVRYKGASVLVLANEDVGRQLWALRSFESDDLDALMSFVRPGDVCFDIGSNFGVVSILFCVHHPGVQIHAFDPLQLNVKLLEVSALLNGGNIQANCAAVSNESGFIDFSESSDGAYSSISATGRRAEKRRVKVRAVTVDQYCQDHGVSAINVAKIDVEGAEMLVLQGASQMLGGKGRPRALMIELYDENLRPYGGSIESVLQLMERYGYAAYARRNGRMLKLSRELHNRVTNVFFLTPALEAEILR
jgi:FkbM family methyltransferase